MPLRRRVLFWVLPLVMPITLNTRAFTQSARADAQQDVARVAVSKPVRAAVQWMQNHEAELRKLQMELVKIPAPPFGEARRAGWLKSKLAAAGIQDVEIDKAGNVVGVRRGSEARAKAIAITAHIDTVFPAETPINVKNEGGRLFAPGISDNGAGVTALLAVALAMKAAPVKTAAPILFVGNVGEEGEGDLRGMRYLFNDSKWKDKIAATLVLDGAGTDSVVTEALGSKRYEIVMRGPGGHSWSDFGTPNPIIVLSRAIARFAETPIPTEPRTSFNIGTISGGTSVNSIPESVSIKVDIRSAVAAEIDRLEKALRDALDRAVKEAPTASSGGGGRKA